MERLYLQMRSQPQLPGVEHIFGKIQFIQVMLYFLSSSFRNDEEIPLVMSTKRNKAECHFWSLAVQWFGISKGKKMLKILQVMNWNPSLHEYLEIRHQCKFLASLSSSVILCCGSKSDELLMYSFDLVRPSQEILINSSWMAEYSQVFPHLTHPLLLSTFLNCIFQPN